MIRSIFLMLSILLIIPSTVLGQGVLRDSDREAIKESADQISKTMSAEGEVASTVADVADKALNLTVDAVTQIAVGLEKAAPEVWRIMIKQQYANAIGDLLGPTLWLIFFFVCLYVMNKKIPLSMMKDLDPYDANIIPFGMVWVLIPIAGLCTMIAFTCNLTSSVKILINPEYYAIKDLLQMITG